MYTQINIMLDFDVEVNTGKYIDMNNTRRSMRHCSGQALHARNGFAAVAVATHPIMTNQLKCSPTLLLTKL